MKYNASKFSSTICVALATLSLCWCIYRDMQFEKQYTGDLRPRIVGARLQIDGISPYFYIWKPSDGVRYYDPEMHVLNRKISNITSSPYLHQLLYPIANFQQRTISTIWLVLEYLALLVMTLLNMQLAKKRKQKWVIVFMSLFFLYSYAWTTNIALGQMYIFIPLLAMLFYFFITFKPTHFLNAAFAGLTAMSLILMRPNTLLFFFPFVFLLNRYSRKFKMVFLLCSSLVILFAFGSSQARLYWSDYFNAMSEHIKSHQGINSIIQNDVPVPMPLYAKWEGWDTLQIKSNTTKFPFKPSGENGNAFVFLNLGLHVKTPLWVLSALCMIAVAILFFMFYKKYVPTPLFNTYTVALLGFCMYMASDIFSPIYRTQYYASQWIFPLLLLASNYSSSYKKLFVFGIGIGLLLNGLGPRLIPMQNTLGEYLIYASILGLLFTMKKAQQNKNEGTITY